MYEGLVLRWNVVLGYYKNAAAKQKKQSSCQHADCNHNIRFLCWFVFCCWHDLSKKKTTIKKKNTPHPAVCESAALTPAGILRMLEGRMTADDAAKELKKWKKTKQKKPECDEGMEIEFGQSCGALIMGRAAGVCVSEWAIEKWAGSRPVNPARESATLRDRW